MVKIPDKRYIEQTDKTTHKFFISINLYTLIYTVYHSIKSCTYHGWVKIDCSGCPTISAQRGVFLSGAPGAEWYYINDFS